MPVLLSLLLSIAALSFAQRQPEPKGYYSSGKISFAWELPLEGEGFMRLFVNRNRGWGSSELLKLIQDSASEMNQRYPMRDRLQIGDLAQPGGGDLTPRHKSHQNGLDVDITYYRLNGVEQLPDIFDEFTEDMVINGKISENFDFERNWTLMKTLHAFGDVQRIFVDQIIKNELCNYARKLGEEESFSEVLRSLRHENHHAHHLHVRLHCPREALECVSQEDPPAGSGCLF